MDIGFSRMGKRNVLNAEGREKMTDYLDEAVRITMAKVVECRIEAWSKAFQDYRDDLNNLSRLEKRLKQLKKEIKG